MLSTAGILALSRTTIPNVPGVTIVSFHVLKCGPPPLISRALKDCRHHCTANFCLPGCYARSFKRLSRTRMASNVSCIRSGEAERAFERHSFGTLLCSVDEISYLLRSCCKGTFKTVSFYHANQTKCDTIADCFLERVILAFSLLLGFVKRTPFYEK